MNGFSADAKKEIAASFDDGKECCVRAFCAALVRSGGRLSLSHEGAKLTLPTLLGTEREILKAELARVGGVTLSSLGGEEVISGVGLTAVLLRFGICVPDDSGAPAFSDRIGPGIVEKDCCAAAYLRGAFLGSGSVSLSDGYHLEFVLSTPALAAGIAELLSRFGVPAKTLGRKDRCVTYVKGGDAVSDALALLGAQEAVLALNSVLAVRSVRRATNRRNNCDIANISRTVNASVRQVEDIEYIASVAGLGSLPGRLSSVAAARLENPDESFSQLASRLAISKSTLKNRLARLCAIADELREKRNMGYEKSNSYDQKSNSETGDNGN